MTGLSSAANSIIAEDASLINKSAVAINGTKE